MSTEQHNLFRNSLSLIKKVFNVYTRVSNTTTLNSAENITSRKYFCFKKSSSVCRFLSASHIIDKGRTRHGLVKQIAWKKPSDSRSWIKSCFFDAIPLCCTSFSPNSWYGLQPTSHFFLLEASSRNWTECSFRNFSFLFWSVFTIISSNFFLQ